MIRNGVGITLVLMAVMMFDGCSTRDTGSVPKDAEGNDKQMDVSKPVTVKILRGASMNDETFQMLILEPMAKKYPNITVEPLSGKLEDLIAAGNIPDLLTTPQNGLPGYRKFDVLEDMTSLLKKHNFDLGRFKPIYIDAIRVASDKGELYAIPYYAQLNALFYNKNLFDKFGVPYPRDGMTWEDAIEVGRKMTRVENGVQIQGLNIEHISRISFPWSPNLVEKKADKDKKIERANVNNETWKNVFELAFRIQSFPGNYPNKDFYKGEAAMYATVGDAFQNIKKAVDSQVFEVGIAQYPSYKELPNTYGMVDEHCIFVTKTSKNKDAAMKVIEVLTSDEVQMTASKYLARQSTLINAELQKQFGSGFLTGVDTQSIFKSKPAPGTEFSVYYSDARKLLDAEYKQVIEGKIDINTALRDLEDQINKMLDRMAVSQ